MMKKNRDISEVLSEQRISKVLRVTFIPKQPIFNSTYGNRMLWLIGRIIIPRMSKDRTSRTKNGMV